MYASLFSEESRARSIFGPIRSLRDGRPLLFNLVESTKSSMWAYSDLGQATVLD